jgi:hypothetical protein
VLVLLVKQLVVKVMMEAILSLTPLLLTVAAVVVDSRATLQMQTSMAGLVVQAVEQRQIML